MKIVMVLTSHDQLGSTGRKTGFWLEELAAPYYTFKDAGVEITLASPRGGRPPLDPKSNEPEFRTDLTVRFEKDAAAEAQLSKTIRLDGVRQGDFDTVFYPGGHGPMWDLAEDEHSIKLIESFIAAGKPDRHCVPFHGGVATRSDAGRQDRNLHGPAALGPRGDPGIEDCGHGRHPHRRPGRHRGRAGRTCRFHAGPAEQGDHAPQSHGLRVHDLH